MPHARLERFDNGKELELEDPNFNIDFIYVLRGGLQIDLELEQLQKIYQGQYDTLSEKKDFSSAKAGKDKNNTSETFQRTMQVACKAEVDDEDDLFQR